MIAAGRHGPAFAVAGFALLAVACDRVELPIHAPAPPLVATPVPRGCYVTTLGAWEPAVDEWNFWYWQIPHTIELTPDEVIQPVVSDDRVSKKLGQWKLEDGRLLVSWSDRVTSVSGKLLPSKEGWSGNAQTFEDGNIDFRRKAPLTLRRTPCGRPAA